MAFYSKNFTALKRTTFISPPALLRLFDFIYIYTKICYFCKGKIRFLECWDFSLNGIDTLYCGGLSGQKVEDLPKIMRWTRNQST
jgi:hypothetical protein